MNTDLHTPFIAAVVASLAAALLLVAPAGAKPTPDVRAPIVVVDDSRLDVFERAVAARMSGTESQPYFASSSPESMALRAQDWVAQTGGAVQTAVRSAPDGFQPQLREPATTSGGSDGGWIGDAELLALLTAFGIGVAATGGVVLLTGRHGRRVAHG